MEVKVNYVELEKMNAQLGISPSESAEAIGRRRRGDFIVHAVDDLRRNRVPPRNAGYSGSDADLQLRPVPGNIDEQYQERGGQKNFLEGADDDDVDAMVDRARNHIEASSDGDDHVPRHERLRKASALLSKAADRLQPKAGSQHLRMK